MTMPTQDWAPLCEQCGAPLRDSTWGEGCLNCLLSSGIEGGNAASVPVSGEVPRRYQHYEILSRPDGRPWELGRGAMGVTYKARDVNLDTPVALKVINARLSIRREARNRFLYEAQAAAQLRHPNVASVFHFGMVPSFASAPRADGTEPETDATDCFYAMEYVEGESLEARLRRSGPLTPHEALELAQQVTRALAAAERQGLVHRDLKPANIMLAVDDEEAAPGVLVKVIDFGLAKPNAVETGPGRFLGTPAFASPEQREGRAIDGRSDIYSLGVTLAYALTGTLPRSSAEGISTWPAPELAQREIPAPVAQLLEAMLAPRREDRPASASALAAKIEFCRQDLNARVGRGWTPRRKWAGLVSVAAAVALLCTLLFYLLPGQSDQDSKSIAVLPFRNLSTDPGNAFFAEGLQDDVLSRLVKIRDLKVISRLGTLAYPADEPRDLRAIGRALGVRHLLEGSLRRDGDQVRLKVSLIDSRNAQEVWSESYNRHLADAINLQGELARDIAEALDATLSTKEKVRVLAKPTQNPDAYLLYLQGRKLENNPGFVIGAFEAAQKLYEQAVAVDPGFALAHARLSITLGTLYRFRGPNDDLGRRAHAEADEALRLDPDLGEAHLAKGLAHYRVERDADRALPELETARRILPNDVEPAITIAYMQRRRGGWRAARAAQENALTLDPLNHSLEHELHATACLLRDWPSAAAHAERAFALAPKVLPLRGERALVDLWQNGNLTLLQRFFREFTHYGDPEGNIAWARWDCAMLARDFGTAQEALKTFPFETLSSVLGAPVPKSYLEGCLWLAQGESARAREAFEMARPAMEAETTAHPENALRHARLGLLYAYMDRKTEAIREGERAVEITPVEKDAIDGHQWRGNLALIQARVGNADQAIDLITHLLREPGCVSPLDESSMTLAELRFRWQWDPLRADPRFQAILAAREPATIY